MAARSARAPQLLYLLGIMFRLGEKRICCLKQGTGTGRHCAGAFIEEVMKTRAVEITNLTTSNLCYLPPTIIRTEQRVYRSLFKPPAVPRRNKWRFVISPIQVRIRDWT